MDPIKAHGGKGSWPFSFERLATSPPQADHVLVDLFSSVADGGLCGKAPPQYRFLQGRNFTRWYKSPREDKRGVNTNNPNKIQSKKIGDQKTGVSIISDLVQNGWHVDFLLVHNVGLPLSSSVFSLCTTGLISDFIIF